jgi:hypothetical protein
MQFFHREPFATPFDNDVIGAVADVPSEYRSRYENGKIVPGVEFVSYDDNSPMSSPEVGKYFRFKEDSRKRGTAVGFVDGELQIFAFFNRVTSAMLQKHLSDARSEGKAVKSMSLLLDVDSSREMIHDLTRWGFQRDASRDTPLFWTWRCDLKKKRRSAVQEDEPKSEPTSELKPTMTIEEYQNKIRELESLRAKIQKLEEGL